MSQFTNSQDLKAGQYKDSSNLEARIVLHHQYTISECEWFEWVMDHILPFMQSRGSVLELGCGRGDLWWKNSDRILPGWSITLTDISGGMLADGLLRVMGSGITGINSSVVNIEEIPFGDSSFDVVIANHMLYHVPDLSRAMSEVRRVIKPDGVFFTSTNGKNHLIELFDFAAHAASDYLIIREGTNPGFSLENGHELLGRYFADVRLVLYDSELRVDAVQPIVDFILSCPMFRKDLPKDKIATDLTNLLELEMERNKGVIRIRKEVGLFIATNQP